MRSVIPRLPGLRRCAILAIMFANPAFAQSQSTAFTFDSQQTLLVFMQPDEAESLLASHRPSAIDPLGPAEIQLIQECTNGQVGKSIATKGPFSGLQRQAVDFLLAQVSERVRREIDLYSTVFSQSVSADYYAAQPTSKGDESLLESRYSCFRFARAEMNESNDMDIAFDFVASIRIAKSQDAVLLKPLRMYVGRTAAKSKDRSLGIAIGIRANAVWRDETRGVKDTIWDEVILTEGVDLSNGPALRYIGNTSKSEVRLPLPPVSYGVDRSQSFGRIDVTVTAAEMGALPTSLDLLGDMLLPSSDRTARLLYLAADARVRAGAP